MGGVTGTAGDATTADEAQPAPSRRLVLIGGLPGAGKTRLLSRLLGAGADGALCGLDSQYVSERLHDRGVRLPYPLLRPAVHAWHRLTVRRVIGGDVPVVVVTDPLTSARRRSGLVEAGRRAGREVRVLLVDVPADTAVRGQERRHRTVGARSMARHDRGWRRVLAQARAGGVEGADRTVVLDRDQVDRLTPRDLLDD